MKLFVFCRSYAIIIILLLNGYVNVRAADAYEGFVMVDIVEDQQELRGREHQQVHNQNGNMQAEWFRQVTQAGASTIEEQAGELPPIKDVKESQAVIQGNASLAAGQTENLRMIAIAAHIIASREITTNASVNDFNVCTKLPTGWMPPIGPMSPSGQALPVQVVWPVLCADHDMTNHDGISGGERTGIAIIDSLGDVSGYCVQGEQGLEKVQCVDHAASLGTDCGAVTLKLSRGDVQTAQTIAGDAHAEAVQHLAQATVIAAQNELVELSNVLVAPDTSSDGRRRSKSHDAVLSTGVSVDGAHIQSEQMEPAAWHDLTLEQRNKRRARRSMSYGSFSSNGAIARINGESISMEHPTVWGEGIGETKQSDDGNVNNGSQEASETSDVRKPHGGVNHGQSAAQPSPLPVEREPRRCGMRNCCLL